MNSWKLLTANMAFYQGVMSRAEAALAAHRLDVKSFFLLSAVEEHAHPAMLARHLLMPKPTITFLIKKLEASGYLKRQTVPGDLRKFKMLLTPAGADAVQAGRKIVSACFGRSLAALTDKERQTYAGIIAKMIDSEAGGAG